MPRAARLRLRALLLAALLLLHALVPLGSAARVGRARAEPEHEHDDAWPGAQPQPQPGDLFPPAAHLRTLLKTAAFLRASRALRALFAADDALFRARAFGIRDAVAGLRATLLANLQCVRDPGARDGLAQVLADQQRQSTPADALSRLARDPSLREKLVATVTLVSRVVAGELRFEQAAAEETSPPMSTIGMIATSVSTRVRDYCARNSDMSVWTSRNQPLEVQIDVAVLRIILGVMWITALYTHIGATTWMIRAGYPLRSRMVAHAVSLAFHFSLGAGFAALVAHLFGGVDCLTLCELSTMMVCGCGLATLGDILAELSERRWSDADSPAETAARKAALERNAMIVRLRTHVPLRIRDYDA